MSTTNTSSEITALGAAETRRRIVARELSPVEVVQAYLERVEEHNGRLNALVTVSSSALDDAEALERELASGLEPGPLCGLPVGIKDVTPVAGLRHTYGCTLYSDNVATEDAVVVERLRAAGAIVLGKTNTPEFATGGNMFNDVFGVTRNPWNEELSAGGSTGGGAAALAARMIALAEGTDLGGSLRIPASFCGVVGLRPTPGLVPTWPTEYPWDTMQVTGLMARTAEDVAIGVQAVAGPSHRAPLGVALDGRDLLAELAAVRPDRLWLAYCPDIAGIGIDAEVEAVCRAAIDDLRSAGASVEEIDLDFSDARDAFLTLRGHWMVVQQHRRLDRRGEFGDNLRGNIDAGLEVTTLELAAAEQKRGEMWDQLLTLFSRFDHVVTPTMAVPPFPVEQSFPETIAGKLMETYIDWVAPTFLLSNTGLPVASVPCGLDGGGLPVGLQIVGRPRGEGAVLGAVAIVQKARPIGLPLG